MTLSRSSFATICFCLAVGPAGIARSEQPASRPAQPNRGELLLRRAQAELARHKTISAKLHQRLRLYGQEMVGSGTFLQGPPERNLLNLDLNIKVAGQDSYLQQRCDGHYFWLQKFVDGVPVLTRIDVHRVEAARAAQFRPGGAAAGVSGAQVVGKGSLPMLDVGGIASLLEQLNAWCVFPRIAEGRLPGPKQTAVLILDGTWRRQRLLAWLPEQKAAVEKGAPINLDKLPAMLPDRIIVTLGRDDLFPRRIEYRVGEGRQIASDQPGPLVQLHFEEIQFDQDIDPRKFQFGSSVVSPIDDTEGYLLRRGLITPAAR